MGGFESLETFLWDGEYLMLWFLLWWDGTWDYDVKVGITDDPTIVAAVVSDFNGVER